MVTRAKEKKFEEDFEKLRLITQEILPILSELEDQVLLNNRTKRPALPNTESAMEYCLALFMFAQTTVFIDLLGLAEQGSHISVGVLCRTLIEGMANVGWITEQNISEEARISRASIIMEQEVEVDELIQGKRSYLSTLKSKGAGTIQDRLKPLGDGWQAYYSHLCSYTHMDGGFFVHYHMGEDQGMRNMAVLMSTLAVLESAKSITSILGLSEYTDQLSMISSQLHEEYIKEQ